MHDNVTLYLYRTLKKVGYNACNSEGSGYIIARFFPKSLKKSRPMKKITLEVFMPQNGDSYTVKLLGIHLGWGNIPDRRTTSRPVIDGEAYIPIPIEYARQFHIYNSNKSGANTLYDVTCLNGQQIRGQFLAQGCISAGDEFAKNFSVQRDLKALGNWFKSVNARVGGYVEICFTACNALTIRYFE